MVNDNDLEGTAETTHTTVREEPGLYKQTTVRVRSGRLIDGDRESFLQTIVQSFANALGERVLGLLEKRMGSRK